MIKAILIDMDDTLLVNPDNVFATHYLRLATEYFSQALGIEVIQPVLLDIVQAMSHQRRGIETNLQLIYRKLSDASGKPHQVIDASIHQFYNTVYPSLSNLITPLSLAPQIIRQVQEQKFALVLATNPIYPSSAIYQRMTWGNLPTDKDAYALVTVADNMHFAKPDPAYYAEIVARVGIEPDEALMIGDNPSNDIKAADMAGLATCIINSAFTLDNLFEEIQSLNWTSKYPAPRLHSPMVSHELRGNIGALFGMLDGIPPTVWAQRPDADEWSILQIVSHLLDSEREAQRPRLQRILEEDNPFIIAPKPPGPGMPILDNDLVALLGQFVEEREKTLELLHNLTETDWQRTARHSVFGLTNILEMAHFTAQHDRIHLNQLCQTIGKCQESSF